MPNSSERPVTGGEGLQARQLRSQSESLEQQLQRARLVEDAFRQESRSEEDLHRENAQLRRQIRELTQQLRRQQRLASTGTMMAMVVHEFNNLLTPIISYAQLAQKNPAMTDKALRKACEGGKRASSICQAILGLAADGSTPEFVTVSEVVADALEAMARDPRKDMIELTVDVPETLVLMAGKVELQQVILNLINNARHALLAKQGSRRMEIRGEGAGKQVTIRVSDSGVGIAEDDLEAIFEPFFSTRKDHEGDTQGHGLGLAVCRDIVDDMGGTIHVESTIGEGSTFTVEIPMANIRRHEV